MVACNNATRYTGVTEAANPMSGVACMCFDSADSNNVDLYQSELVFFLLFPSFFEEASEPPQHTAAGAESVSLHRLKALP